MRGPDYTNSLVGVLTRFQSQGTHERQRRPTISVVERRRLVYKPNRLPNDSPLVWCDILAKLCLLCPQEDSWQQNRIWRCDHDCLWELLCGQLSKICGKQGRCNKTFDQLRPGRSANGAHIGSAVEHFLRLLRVQGEHQGEAYYTTRHTLNRELTLWPPWFPRPIHLISQDVTTVAMQTRNELGRAGKQRWPANME